MAVDPDEVMALVPDEFGSLAVCSVADLYRKLDEVDSLDAALDDCSIDMVAANAEQVARVRALNTTGDAAAYWNL